MKTKSGIDEKALKDKSRNVILLEFEKERDDILLLLKLISVRSGIAGNTIVPVKVPCDKSIREITFVPNESDRGNVQYDASIDLSCG